MSSLFKKDIKELKGVGEKRTKLFNKFGVYTIGELLFFYPRTYENWNPIYSIHNAPLNFPCCIKAKVISNIQKNIIRKNCIIYKVTVHDGISSMYITFFNNYYVTEQLTENHEFLFYGRINMNYNRFEMTSPDFVQLSQYAPIRPVYSQTHGITSKQIEMCVRNALQLLPSNIKDTIPEYIKQKYNLCSLKFALENIHFPKSKTELELSKKRLIFEEFLVLQLGMQKLNNINKSYSSLKINNNCIDEFYSLLPFFPTNAQKRVITECINDILTSKYPMSRLIQGDVGSGKTVIAAALCYLFAKNKLQIAFMVPTEILANQHFIWLKNIFSNSDINIEILSGSITKSQKEKIKQKLDNGEIDIVIGTHALISDNVIFKNLGLVITDEQHRFGVSQRAKLISKGEHPHVLVMSATPIPRTLSLILYGDLSISIIDELPPNRQKIDTFHINSDKRERAFNFTKKALDEGRQAYIVCPIIEENNRNMISAESYYYKIKNEQFKNYNVGLIHGKMKPKDKDKIMLDFSNGKIDVLVSTTVIEVGLNVPNSVIMIIENAERFGLAQLHQLRGRVGRGLYKSYCILVSDAQNKDALSRFRIMVQTNDGFVIANEDLKLRGPGDFFGGQQHGLPELKIGNIVDDVELLYLSKSAAINIISSDPNLELPENRMLLKAVEMLFKNSIQNGFN